MNDWIIGAIHVAVAVCVFSFGWMVSASTIGWECRNMGVFYVGQKIYDCKPKENT